MRYSNLKQAITQEINPFDTISRRYGNFWKDKQNERSTVREIHQEAIAKTEFHLQQVAQDSRTRTILMYGDSGSGKSYLLGRLKSQFNHRAFFVYIGCCIHENSFMRHVLRQLVDSLLEIPEGQKESQLILWIKSLAAFKSQGLVKKIVGEKNLFVHNFTSSYPRGIYNPQEFFGVLYDLTDPGLHALAAQWLRGDNLDEESLRKLSVKESIQTEYAAEKIIENIGKIAHKTLPIVLCFDEIEHESVRSVIRLNTHIHNESLKNFLVIISIITNIAKQQANQIKSSDRARIDDRVLLKPISIDLVEKIWSYYLQPLHQLVNESPESDIAPLKTEDVQNHFPGNKVLVREAIAVGRDFINAYKRQMLQEVSRQKNTSNKTHKPSHKLTPKDDLNSSFKLYWKSVIDGVKSEIATPTDVPDALLHQALMSALFVGKIDNVKEPCLPSPKFGENSFCFQNKDGQNVLISWQETPNLTNFCHIMKAYEKSLSQYKTGLYILIRSNRVGQPKNKGYRIYKKLCELERFRHLCPSLSSIHELIAYSRLEASARSLDLSVGSQILDLKALQKLTLETEILSHNALLADIGVIQSTTPPPPDKEIQDFIYDFLKTEPLYGYENLLATVSAQFDNTTKARVETVVMELVEQNMVEVAGQGENAKCIYLVS